MTDRIAAIYTTYRPDAGLGERIAPVAACCAATIVVDNTPGGVPLGLGKDIVVLQDGCNKGLPGALNLGLDAARRADCNVAVLFDQDSTPSPSFIATLLAGLQAAGGRACVGPTLVDDQVVERQEAGRSLAPGSTPLLNEVTCLPTSGMMFRIDALDGDERFSPELFLDFVDFDWCWRLRAKGWRIVRLPQLPMLHRLGLAQRRALGLTFHVPAPYRHYFQFRDTLRLLGWHHAPLYAKCRLAAILVPKVLVYPFILDRGWERLTWMWAGIRDYLKGVGGVGAAGAKLAPETLHSLSNP